MSDPVRLRDDRHASPRVRELLSAAASPASQPPALDRATRRAAAAFAATLAATDVASAAGAAVTVWNAKWIAGVVVVIGVVAGGSAIIAPTDRTPEHEAAPAALRSSASSPRASAPIDPRDELSTPPLPRDAAPTTSPLDEETAAPAVAPPARGTAPTTAASAAATRGTHVLPSPAPSGDVDALTIEATLLERARAALAADPGTALQLADQHAREHAGGQLVSERELIAIDALLRQGRREEARQRAETLIARAPRGMYARRLERMLTRESASPP